MIYVISFITGVLNGVFASGAGQILVLYLIYIMKIDTYEARALSVSVLSISSIFALIGYVSFVDLKLEIAILVVVISIVTGIIGTKLMRKIPAEVLNLISGILLVSLTLYKILGE